MRKRRGSTQAHDTSYNYITQCHLPDCQHSTTETAQERVNTEKYLTKNIKATSEPQKHRCKSGSSLGYGVQMCRTVHVRSECVFNAFVVSYCVYILPSDVMGLYR